MVTLILGKTLVAWSGWLAGIFFFGGLFTRFFINKLKDIDIEKEEDKQAIIYFDYNFCADAYDSRITFIFI